MLLLVYCFMYLPLLVGLLCWYLFWCALLYILSSFASSLTRKRKLVALLLLYLLYFGCIAAVNVLWLFPAVPRVVLKCVIVVVPDHTHLLFGANWSKKA